MAHLQTLVMLMSDESSRPKLTSGNSFAAQMRNGLRNVSAMQFL